jgi:hypothetical protein
MKLDTSFNSAFSQLQNGVNDARKAAGEVINATDSEKVKAVEVTPENNNGDRSGTGGINVTA